jgi:hypothetical protein
MKKEIVEAVSKWKYLVIVDDNDSRYKKMT